MKARGETTSGHNCPCLNG